MGDPDDPSALARLWRRLGAGAPVERLRRLVRDPETRRVGPLRFAALSILLGVFAGLGAVVFRGLIALVHNLAFYGTLSTTFDTNQHAAPSVWGWGFVAVPVVGALGVVYLVKHFAPEAKGHGVPEVIDAIYYKKGVIRPVVAAVKALASALSIGTGGSVGREGPIIQIGAAFSSWLGQRLRVSRWQLVTLIAAGGGAGIAATFNTPIGGVLFAVEVLLHEVSVRTLVPVALATATATFIGERFFGAHPAFSIPELGISGATTAIMLPAYLGLGVLTALVSAGFIKALYASEDLFERLIPKREYLRHAVGMLGVGLVAMTLMAVGGHYYVQGVGYATVMDVLNGTLTGAFVLFGLFALKLLVTCLTLGSGASGGVFSPSLFMGATLGGAYGVLLDLAFPALHVHPAAFAVVGMAGVVAGATSAALTAIVMIFEMTLDYSVVLPMTLTVAVSYGLRRYLLADSVYTMKLTRRGHATPQALQSNAYLLHHVSEVVISDVATLPSGAPPSALDLGEDRPGPAHVVVLDGAAVVGVISREWALGHPAALARAGTVGEVAQRDVITATPETTLFTVMGDLLDAGASAAVVMAQAGGGDVLGLITNAHLAEVIAEGMALFDD